MGRTTPKPTLMIVLVGRAKFKTIKTIRQANKPNITSLGLLVIAPPKIRQMGNCFILLNNIINFNGLTNKCWFAKLAIFKTYAF